MRFAQVVAREEELCLCQQRLAARETEVRDVRELLQSSLQPRIAIEPVPRLISLASAALETGAVPDVQSLRQQVTQRSAARMAQEACSGFSARAQSHQVTQQAAAPARPERAPGIARDPSLSTWQGSRARNVAAEELRGSAAAQQGCLPGPSHDNKPALSDVPELWVSRQGSLSPKKRPGSRRTAATATSQSSAQQKPRPAPLSIAAGGDEIENAATPHNQATPFGQKQVLSRLKWSTQKSGSPMGEHVAFSRHGSLRSAPSTPLSPTNASLAPTRRLPQPGRLEAGMQTEVAFCSFPIKD